MMESAPAKDLVALRASAIVLIKNVWQSAIAVSRVISV